jgi:hypothetical protein
VTAPVREAGGDNTVPRDAKGRPRIWVECDPCNDPFAENYVEQRGKVASPKTGKPINCSRCSGKGRVQRSYTRTTTHIDVLDDKSNIEAWQMRMVLVGVARDTSLINDVTTLYAEQQDAEKRLRDLLPSADDGEIFDAKAAVKAPKDALNRKAQAAKKTAGAEDKADKGTELHGLSEMVDLGQELPHGISFEDVLDLDAYRRISEGFHIIHMEQLVVSDALKVAGTPDRVSEWRGDHPLIAPDGTEYVPNSGVRLITDLKTGTVEYGGLKMAMQLAIYANSDLYDPESGERMPLENICRKWGIIMNVPAGTGEGARYWADLTLGWRAVEVAGLVREMRRFGGKALTLLPR